MGSPLRCPLFNIWKQLAAYWAAHSLICMAKFPWAAHSTAHFLIFGSSGLPTELPTELPTVSIYGSSGQPNLHGKIPMGSPLRCPRAAHGQWSGQLPCFFRMGYQDFLHVFYDIKVPFCLSLTFCVNYLVKFNILTTNWKDSVICYNMSNIQRL